MSLSQFSGMRGGLQCDPAQWIKAHRDTSQLDGTELYLAVGNATADEFAKVGSSSVQQSWKDSKYWVQRRTELLTVFHASVTVLARTFVNSPIRLAWGVLIYFVHGGVRP